MTTPRFPQDFWSKRRPAPGDEELMQPVDARRRSIAGFYDGHLFFDADTQLFRELEAEHRIDPLHADGPWRVVSHWAPGLGDNPQSLFIPEHYTPKYAYPLMVWLTDDERPSDLAELMPDVSTRNFFGLACPIPRAAAPRTGAAASTAAETSAPLLDHLKQSVLDVRRRFHIHSERIYLAGLDAGASWALDLVLRKPEWFGGAVVLGGRVPSMKEALSQFGNLQGKRVLLGSTPASGPAEGSDMKAAGQLLHSAGMQVETHEFDPAQGEARMLSQVNRWMMDGICAMA